MSESHKIILCTTCHGKGVIEHEELTNYHKREYDSWFETCRTCEGNGRVVEITTITHQPIPKYEVGR